ncbi:zinc ribbon domain-containing protein [Hungatella hathewayi]|uniref:zinc ribbon domain-containing protein n=1 Tax=Hungatella hathewayi TaxID=154046 RepID=UPI00356396C9
MIRTVHQYSNGKISNEDMVQLEAVAADYRIVKQYVYNRYSGIGSMDKLYPGYTVQNEMTCCGLRQKLDMPSVYYNLAIFDALGDIKAEWTRTKGKIADNIKANENLTEEERHYLRYVIKISTAYTAVLRHTDYELPISFGNIFSKQDIKRLNNYLCRQTRRHLKSPSVKCTDGFQVSERAYRYGSGGIYLTVKAKRRRVFIPLTDRNQYTRQLFVRLDRENSSVTIDVPVEVRCRARGGKNQIGLSVSYQAMYTSSSGNKYGERLGAYLQELANWMRERKAVRKQLYNRVPLTDDIICNNFGDKKYRAQKNRYDEKLKSYINHEINRLIQEEEPEMIFIPKLPQTHSFSGDKRFNRTMTVWRRGYIRQRLLQKCEAGGITVAEVFGKDISNCCCRCGKPGLKKNGFFYCESCGWEGEDRLNAAVNALNRGKAADVHSTSFRMNTVDCI